MKNTNSEEPLVSIIIPCYRHEQFIGDCLQSVMEQDYNSIELLICDDCSPDKSWTVIMEYKERLEKCFGRVVLLKNSSNLGITKSLNIMLRETKGKYIKNIASDDMLANNCISEFVSVFERESDIDVLVSNGYIFQEEKHFPVSKIGKNFYLENPDFTQKDLFFRIYSLNMIFAPGAMVRKSVYDKYGIYDEEIFIEDWEYWLRITLDNQCKIGYLNKCLVYYRVSANSVTAAQVNAGLEERRKRIHKAEMKLIDKYGIKLPTRIYASRKLWCIEAEQIFAYETNLTEMKKILQQEMIEFTMWKELGIRKLLGFQKRKILRAIKYKE